MSMETYEELLSTNQIDKAIFEAEREVAEGAELLDAREALGELRRNIWDKYTVKMFPQEYRDIDKIYEQALLVSNYADDAIALAENLKKQF